jgi:hypothetical protein
MLLISKLVKAVIFFKTVLAEVKEFLITYFNPNSAIGIAKSIKKF